MTGTIKKIIIQKGYGFITPDDGSVWRREHKLKTSMKVIRFSSKRERVRRVRLPST